MTAMTSVATLWIRNNPARPYRTDRYEMTMRTNHNDGREILLEKKDGTLYSIIHVVGAQGERRTICSCPDWVRRHEPLPYSDGCKHIRALVNIGAIVNCSGIPASATSIEDQHIAAQGQINDWCFDRGLTPSFTPRLAELFCTRDDGSVNVATMWVNLVKATYGMQERAGVEIERRAREVEAGERMESGHIL